MDPFHINPICDPNFAETFDVEPQQEQTGPSQQHLNELQRSELSQILPNSDFGQPCVVSHTDAVWLKMLLEVGAKESSSLWPADPSAHSPVRSVNREAVFAVADRGGPLPARSFTSVDFWQSRGPAVHSPAQGFNQAELPQTGGDDAVPGPMTATYAGEKNLRASSDLHTVASGASIRSAHFKWVISTQPPLDISPGRMRQSADLSRAPMTSSGQLPVNLQGDITSSTRYPSPAGAQHEAAAVKQSGPRKRGRGHPDEVLLADYRRKASATGLKDSTISHDIGTLRKLSKWLAANHQSQIEGRLYDRGLGRLAQEFAGNNPSSLSAFNCALKRLRQADTEQQVTVGGHSASERDEILFADFRRIARDSGMKDGTIADDIWALRKFSKWLAENHQSQIDGRTQDPKLDRLAEDCAGQDVALLHHIKSALSRLRQAHAQERVTTVRRFSRGRVPPCTRSDEGILTDNRDVNSDDVPSSSGRQVTAARAARACLARPATADDQALLADYNKKAATDNVKENTIKADIVALRRFSAWLAENHQSQITGRLDDPGLDKLAVAFAGKDVWRVTPALKRLRQANANQRVRVSCKERPVTDAGQLIDAACNAAISSGYGKDTIKQYRSTLLRFNEWLTQRFGKGIIDLGREELGRAVEEFRTSSFYRRMFDGAWRLLQNCRQMVEANNVLGIANHGRGGSHQEEGDPQVGVAQRAAASPILPSPSNSDAETLRAVSGGEWIQPTLLLSAVDSPEFYEQRTVGPQLRPLSPSRPAAPAQPAGSSSAFGGLEQLSSPPSRCRGSDFDPNALAPEELQDDAHGDALSGWTIGTNSSSLYAPDYRLSIARDGSSQRGGWSPIALSAGPSAGELLQLNEGEAAQPGSSRRSSQIYAGLDDFVDFEDDAHSALAPDHATPLFANPSSSGAPRAASSALSGRYGGVPDFGEYLDLDSWSHSLWDHGGRQAPDDLLPLLNESNYLPNQFQSTTEFGIGGQHYTAERRERQANPNRLFSSQPSYYIHLIRHPQG